MQEPEPADEGNRNALDGRERRIDGGIGEPASKQSLAQILVNPARRLNYWQTPSTTMLLRNPDGRIVDTAGVEVRIQAANPRVAKFATDGDLTSPIAANSGRQTTRLFKV